MTTTWSVPALLLIGFVLGPYGLHLLKPSVLQLLDPIAAMALAMVGTFVGLSLDFNRGAASWSAPALGGRPSAQFAPPLRWPRIDITVALVVVGGLTTVVLRNPAPISVFLITLALIIVAIVVSLAGWLLIGQTDSEREQQVFVVGSLLLLGGAAAYLSLSALFAGLLAGIVWSVAGNLARVRIIKELDYFQHPLMVLLLIVAGSSISISIEVLTVAAAVLSLHLISRPITHPFHVSAAMVGIALAFDVFRGVMG